MTLISSISFFFFFNDTATTEIYTLSLHDALPIYVHECSRHLSPIAKLQGTLPQAAASDDGNSISGDRKSTRLNSSHSQISYAVFCLKKKKKKHAQLPPFHALIPLLLCLRIKCRAC